MSIFHKVIVKAWVEKDGKYLLAKRASSEKHNAGVWSLPGGNVDDDNEDNILEKTIKRELMEETGIEITDDIKCIFNNSFIKPYDNSHVVNVTFLCHWKAREAKPLEDTEEIKWLSLAELEKLDNKQDFLVKEVTHLKRYLSR